MTYAALQASFVSFVMTNLHWFLVPLTPALGVFVWRTINPLLR